MQNNTKSLSALIVDDSGEFRSLFKTHLRHVGVKVLGELGSAKSLETHIKKLQPDVLFLDINMPGQSGLEVLPELKKQFPFLYVVVITGDSSEEIVKGALSGGADAYVLKPFSPKKVDEILDECWLKLGKQDLLQCMLIDDEALARDLLEKELQKLNAQTQKFETPATLFDALDEGLPDILFLDIQMPEMDGHEVLLKVKEKNPELYVVMVSGNSDIENVKKAIELGADSFLVKPVVSKKLKECLDAFRKKRSA